MPTIFTDTFLAAIWALGNISFEIETFILYIIFMRDILLSSDESDESPIAPF